MIIMRSLGQDDEDRYPYWRPPVIVPKSPVEERVRRELLQPTTTPQPGLSVRWLGFGAIILYAAYHIAKSTTQLADFDAVPIPSPVRLKWRSPGQMRKMELRRHIKTNTLMYVDWDDPRQSVEWYGPRYSQRRKITLYPQYRESGEPLYAAKRSYIEQVSEQAAQMRLFSGDIMTCAEWDVKKKRGKEYIRCVRFAPNCSPGVPCVRQSPNKPIKPSVRKEREREKEKPIITEEPKPKRKKEATLTVKKADLSPEEWKVINTMSGKKMHIDEIGRKAGLPPYKVSAALVMLELKGLVHQSAGKMFEPASETSETFSGEILSCGIWIKDPYAKIGRPYCAAYGPTCGGQKVCVSPKKKNQKKVCILTKMVESAYYGKDVERCSKYAAACTTGACLLDPMPYPGADHEPTEAEIRDVAKSLAQDYNLMQKEAGPALARDILSRGGIRAYKKGHLKEEYIENVPLVLKRKTGLPLDEMASELNVDEATLISWLQEAYPKGGVQRRKSWRDFEADAYNILMEERAGLGQVRKRYHRFSINEAIDAALAREAEYPLYIFATYYGYTIWNDPPPSTQGFVVVYPDGKVEEYRLSMGQYIVKELKKTVPI